MLRTILSSNERRETLRFHCELSAFSEIDLACAENRDLRDVFHRLWDPDNWNASGQKSLPKLMFGENPASLGALAVLLWIRLECPQR